MPPTSSCGTLFTSIRNVHFQLVTMMWWKSTLRNEVKRVLSDGSPRWTWSKDMLGNEIKMVMFRKQNYTNPTDSVTKLFSYLHYSMTVYLR